jgi:RNase P/RNase MRP subunit p30
MISETNFNKLRELVKKEKKPIIFSSKDDELNRKVLEKLPINILLLPLETRKDFSKQRDSGFNQVLAKIAQKNKIQIGVNLDEIIESPNKIKILSRIKQNIKLCNKNKVFIQFIQNKNKRELHELKSLGTILGMPTWMTSKLEIISQKE